MPNFLVSGPPSRPALGPVGVSPAPSRGLGARRPAGPAGRALALVASAGRRCLGDLWTACRATYDQPARAAAAVRSRWRGRSLRLAFLDAKLALGLGMYAAGIDDGELGMQISALDDRIGRGGTDRRTVKALRNEREQLVLRLAEAALAEKGPLPGADAVYARACEAEAAVLNQDRVRPGRTFVGYARIGGTLAIFLTHWVPQIPT